MDVVNVGLNGFVTDCGCCGLCECEIGIVSVIDGVLKPMDLDIGVDA